MIEGGREGGREGGNKLVETGAEGEVVAGFRERVDGVGEVDSKDEEGDSGREKRMVGRLRRQSEMGDTWREELNGKMIEDSTYCTSMTVGGRVDGSYTLKNINY